MRQKLSFEGAFARGARELPVRYLPFEVPPGVRRLEVSYHFARAEPQPEGEPDDVVDIGVTAIISDLRGDPLMIAGPASDRVDSNDISYNKVFPYAATPLNGRNHGHH